jgi:hypothetical protein
MLTTYWSAFRVSSLTIKKGKHMIKTVQYEPGMTIEAPCFVEGMPNDVYHAWPEGVSSSGLKMMERSPAHFRFQAKRTPSRAMELGTAIHTALLEPERFAADYVLLRDVEDRRRTEYKQAVAVHGSERVLVSTEADRVAGMQEAVLSNPAMGERFRRSGWRELSLFVRDPVTQVLVRVRFDLLTDGGLIIDLKSAADCSAEAFSRSCANYGYDLSAALYDDAFQWATGSASAGFEFAVIESEMPHAHKLYEPDHLMMQAGRKRYRAALDLFAECEKDNHWPLPECTGPELISLPEWAINYDESEIV